MNSRLNGTEAALLTNLHGVHFKQFQKHYVCLANVQRNDLVFFYFSLNGYHQACCSSGLRRTHGPTLFSQYLGYRSWITSAVVLRDCPCQCDRLQRQSTRLQCFISRGRGSREPWPRDICGESNGNGFRFRKQLFGKSTKNVYPLLISLEL